VPYFVFLKSCRLWSNMEKILYSGAGHRWYYGACALHAVYLKLQIHTLRLCNTHCFSTTTMIARTSLNVTFDVHCLSFFVSGSSEIWENVEELRCGPIFLVLSLSVLATNATEENRRDPCGEIDRRTKADTSSRFIFHVPFTWSTLHSIINLHVFTAQQLLTEP